MSAQRLYAEFQRVMARLDAVERKLDRKAADREAEESKAARSRADA